MKSRSEAPGWLSRMNKPRGLLPAPPFPHVLHRPEWGRGRHVQTDFGAFEVVEGRKQHFCRCRDCGAEFPADCSDAGYRHALTTGHVLVEHHAVEVVRAPRSGEGYRISPAHGPRHDAGQGAPESLIETEKTPPLK